MRIIRQNWRNIAALALALILAMLLLLSVTVMLAATGHLCAGEHCPVCLTVITLRALLHQLELAGIMILLGSGYPIAQGRRARMRPSRAYRRTPVTLHTRLNN